MRDGWTIQRLMIVVATAIILITAVAVALFSFVYCSVLTEAFADLTNAWPAMGDEEMMEIAARFLLLGSVLYVQVVSDGEFLVDVQVQELLEMVGLAGLERRNPTELSAGQRQRVARALAL